MAEFTATATPAEPSIHSSWGVMQRQCAATSRWDRNPTLARYSVGSIPRCSRTAATSPQIWFRWMVAMTSSSPCRPRRRISISGEQSSGAHAASPTCTRPSPLPFQRLCRSAMRARLVSARAASISNGATLADRGAGAIPRALAEEQA